MNERSPEPSLEISGGDVRPSRIVDRSTFPALQARERVLRVLRTHDPDSQLSERQELDESDRAIVRLIAQEGAVANGEPSARYSAIAAMARSAAPDDVNLLTDLAQFGEDFYVRAHALLALGTLGHLAALSTIAPHLDASERFERQAARRAVALIARGASPERVRAHAALLHEDLGDAISQILDEPAEPIRRGGRNRTAQLEAADLSVASTEG